MSEIARARQYTSQALALFARAKTLEGTEVIGNELVKLAASLSPLGTHNGFVPDDAETCLHQTSLALVNVVGSLSASNMIAEANMANEIRGLIMSWFDSR